MEMRKNYPSTAADWTPYQALIKRLYIDQRWSLKQVREFLESKHGFKATEQMYKRRIRIWRIDKKRKEHEVLEILRLQAERATEGKPSTFLLRGQVVDMKDLKRYFRRKKLPLCQQSVNSEFEAYNRLLVTKHVPDLVCRTPSPNTTIADPGRVLDVEETFYLLFHRYLSGAIESGIWKPSKRPSNLHDSLSRSGGWIDIQSTIVRGATRFDNAQYERALWHWRVAFKQLEDVVSSWNYYQLLNLIGAVNHLAERDVHVAAMFLKHLKDLASQLLGHNNPQRLILLSLAGLDPTAFLRFLLFTRRCCLPIFRAHFAEQYEDFVLFWETALAQLESGESTWTFSPRLVERMMARLSQPQLEDAMLMTAAERLSDTLKKSNHLEEAEIMDNLRIERLEGMNLNGYLSGQLLRAFADLGTVQQKLGKLLEAYHSFSHAVAYDKFLMLRWKDKREDHAWRDQIMGHVLRCLVDLELMLGLSGNAIQLKQDIIRLANTSDEEAFQLLSAEDLQTSRDDEGNMGQHWCNHVESKQPHRDDLLFECR